MDQLKKLIGALSMAQKIALAAVIIAVAAGVPLFTKWQHERDFKALFTNMSPEDAGAVVTKLKESGVEHRLSDNGTTVLVSADKVDEVRLELAGAGLPKSGRIGFELFDKTNIGLTDFSEHVNYRRALEGELERSIKAINQIDQARVHVTFPKESVFLDSREPAKASVLVHLRAGSVLQPQNVAAISNLVASAVEGLSPDSVAVLDMQGNLLNRPRKNSLDPNDPGDGLLDYKHQVEKDLMSKVEATLDPLLGEGKFRVGISAECDFSTSEQTDETYDPTRSVMSSSQKTEDMMSTAQSAGVPGTPSNLPRSTIKPLAGGSGGAGSSRRTESVAFETSRTVRQVKVPRGTIKRLSASVLFDQDFEWQGKGPQRKKVLVPPTPEKLKVVHDIVAAVIGLQADRGDQLVIESLPFEQTRELEQTPDAAAKSAVGSVAKTPLAKLLEDRRVLVGGGAGALVLLLLIGFLLGRRRKVVQVEVAPGTPALSEGKAQDGTPKGKPAAIPAEAEKAALPLPIPTLALPEMNSKSKILLLQIQDHVAKDPALAANIVRGWMEED
jgi:flagellar M-ring protein FliF